MIYIENLKIRDAAFNFAIEEFVVNSNMDVPVIMLWQADNCVMLGRNQIAKAELNLNFVNKNKVSVVRRSSGGGTIFTDSGTFLYTIITKGTSSQSNFLAAKDVMSNSIAASLAALNINAKIEGRNDILVDNKKITGIAQYALNGKICTHGSLLFNTNLDYLQKVLTPDKAKLSQKSLPSVKSRVTNLCNYLASSFLVNDTPSFINLFKEHLFSFFNLQAKDKVNYVFSDTELKKIEKIRQEKYANPKWNYIKTPKYSVWRERRFSGGKVELALDIRDNVVENCKIFGDFLALENVLALEKLLQGVPYDKSFLKNVLKDIDLSPYLGTVTRDEFLSLLL